MSEGTQTVLVTGSGGFVGRNLVPMLDNLGVRVIEHRRTQTGDAKECYGFDLANPPAEAFDILGKPETIIHLAWGGLPNYESRHHYEIELPMHYRFLKQMVEAGARKLVVIGTCFEYGKIEGCLHEEMVPDPKNAYGYAKDALRRQLTFLEEKSGFELIWIRLFYLHGNGQSSRSLFAQLDAAIRGGDATFSMTGGEQLRDYLPVDYAARVISRLALETIGSHVVNVCSGVPRSVRSLVEARIAETESDIVPLYGALPYSPHEAMAFWGDRSKLNQILSK